MLTEQYFSKAEHFQFNCDEFLGHIMIPVDNIPKPNSDFLYGFRTFSERYMTILILHLTK